MDNIFFSFSLSEFKPLVELVSRRMSESDTLRQCGLVPHQMAKIEAYKDMSLESRLNSVRESRYLVCLLGNNAGCLTRDGKTDIELEIEAAIDAGVDVFAFLIGADYQEHATLPQGMTDIFASLSDHVSISTLATEDFDYIARQIVNKIEADVWLSLGEAHQLSDSHDLHDISGFPRDNLESLPVHAQQQLARIYSPTDGQPTQSGLAANVNQRKVWALKSLEVGHQEHAINNLQKAGEDFGSDFFVCFWLSRLFALHGTTEEHWRTSLEYSNGLAKMLVDEDLLTHALYLNHKGVVHLKQNELETAELVLTQAYDYYRNYESLELLTKVYLTQVEQGKAERLELAQETMERLLRQRVSQYISVINHLQQEFPKYANLVNRRVIEQQDKFYLDVNRSLQENRDWSQNRLEQRESQRPEIGDNPSLLQRVYTTSQHVWLNYSTLRKAAVTLSERYTAITAKLSALPKVRDSLDTDNSSIQLLFTGLREALSEREECRLNVVSQEQKIKKIEDSKLRDWGVLAGLLMALFAVVFTLPIPFWIVSMALVILWGFFIKQKDSKYHRYQFERRRLASLESSLNEGIGELLQTEQSSWYLATTQPLLKTMAEDLQHLTFKDVDQKEVEYFELWQQALDENDEQMSLICHERQQLFTKVKHWLARVNKFEQSVISAHSGQYNYLTCRKGQVSVGWKIELKTSALQNVVWGESSKQFVGRALHVHNDRLAAWFDDTAIATELIDGVKSIPCESVNVAEEQSNNRLNECA
ncbi:hypothetical protein EGH82_11005 [Vibrio ponticus]|uniref:DUF4062 domain-containing protein n=1 Tax=Vibrio ponticus TaxID=265668 RepID=A0A3N3DZR2_9VIBR|nr:hypothetical protein [Vibrio ponticus]ROV59983.1 hypothetical protein EGH82_11005 [Vibrio ponticus]